MPYITPDFLRVAPYNLTVEMASDVVVEANIAAWSQAIDRMCDQFFEIRSATVLIDGNDTDTLHLGVPIVEVTELRANGDSTPLDTSLYRVYNRRQAPNDDRRNPRIALIRSEDVNDIYVSAWPNRMAKFRKGRQNQVVVGDFGFVESDDSTPYLIQRAVALLVIEKLTQPIIEDPTTIPPELSALYGPVLEEATDGHRRRYAQRGGATKPSAVGLRGITENPEILDIVKLYKAPIRMASTTTWSYD